MKSLFGALLKEKIRDSLLITGKCLFFLQISHKITFSSHTWSFISGGIVRICIRTCTRWQNARWFEIFVLLTFWFYTLIHVRDQILVENIKSLCVWFCCLCTQLVSSAVRITWIFRYLCSKFVVECVKNCALELYRLIQILRWCK